MATELDSIDVVLAWPVDPATAAPISSPVIFASHPGWATAPTDSPASQAALSSFRALDETAKWWRHEGGEPFLVGGAGRHGGASISIANPRMLDGDTYTHPLDSVADYIWDDCVVEIWGADATVGQDGLPSLKITLADMSQLGTYRCESMSIGDTEAALRLREPDTRQLPSTPFAFRGYGFMAYSDITRADHSALRATGDFTIRLTMVLISDTDSGPFTIFDTPLVRLRRDLTDLVWEIRNSSGSWQGFTAFAGLSTFEVGTFHIVYSSTAPYNAKLYFRSNILGTGEILETIEVTGGLYASASADATTWSTATQDWYCAGFGHLSVTESDDWVAEDGLRGIEIHPSMTCGLPFDEPIGNIGEDITGNQDADVALATRSNTGEGLASLAGFRPPAVIGLGFGLPLILQTLTDRFIAGYGGNRDRIRGVTQDGFRLRPAVTGATAGLVITASRNTLAPIPTPWAFAPADFSQSQLEFAPGQSLERSDTPANNPKTFTVDRVILPDARLGVAEAPGRLTTTTNQENDDSVSVAISDNSDTEYAAGSNSIVRGTKTYILPRADIDSAVAATGGVLQMHFARHEDDDADSAVRHATTSFGPEQTAVDVEHLKASSEIWQHGWMVPGSTPWGDLIDRIAMSSLSVDDGPVAMYYKSDGAVAFRGMRLDAASSDDVTILSGQIRDITEVEGPARPNDLTVRFSKNHHRLEVVESIAATDSLTRELRIEWRESRFGSGARRGVFVSSLMRPNDAYRQARALHRLQRYPVFRVELYAPVSHSFMRQATAGPGLQVTIEWEKVAFWAAGRTAWTVGYERGRVGPATKLVLYVITEKA